MKEFIAQIINSLNSNGFPNKRVSLPTEKMYEIADKKGLSLNSVLEKMKEDESINFDIGVEKIIFDKAVSNESSSGFEGVDNDQMMAQAQEMIKNMDPEEMKQVQEMFQNMREEEKADIMQKGRDMGLMK